MFLSDAQIDTAGAIVSAAPTDAGPVQTITVTGERPTNYWPWIIIGAVVVLLIYYGSRRK